MSLPLTDDLGASFKINEEQVTEPLLNSEEDKEDLVADLRQSINANNDGDKGELLIQEEDRDNDRKDFD